ncbi:hypothetical protein LXA43DRAFT_1090993 [Ganoderma leucocontextum]|nr:hypothetical protein LXA43DRAFT_1090993 [Ganoderma leucocontextum]
MPPFVRYQVCTLEREMVDGYKRRDGSVEHLAADDLRLCIGARSEVAKQLAFCVRVVFTLRVGPQWRMQYQRAVLGSQLSQLINALESNLVANQCGLAITALYIYDYAITFAREVELFWGRRFTGASLLFLLNRYLNLAHIIVEVCNFARMSDQAISILPYFVWAFFSSIRAYALCRQHWVLSGTILAQSLVPTGINYSEYRWLVPINDPILGCGGDLTVPAALAKQTAGLDMTFSSLLLRDGTIYFLILLILNTLHLTFTLLSVVHTSSPVSYITLFTEPITAVLVSRFLLDLQEVNRGIESGSQSATNSDSVSQTGTIAFARVVGSLGSMIASPEGSLHSHHELGLSPSSKGHGSAGDSTPDEMHSRQE